MLLRDNVSEYLIRFTGRLEEKQLVSNDLATKIRKYVRAEESPSQWYLVLILGGILGALTFAAGVYAIISHNWYDFPIWLRGVLGFVPAAAGLFFYYRMLQKHPTSKTWIETTSIFLMLMIGASIATTTQTYHMGGDYEDFLFTMLWVTVPLFYIKRASGIVVFYLLLALIYLAIDVRIDFSLEDSFIDFGSNSVWFWLFVILLLPHYFTSLDRESKEQGFRFRFLTFALYLTVFIAIMMSVDSNRLLWALTYNVGVYVLAHRYMGDHFWFRLRFMSWIPQVIIALILLSITFRFVLYQAFQYDSVMEMDDWGGGQWYYFVLLLVVMAGVYYNYFKGREHFENVNQLVLFAPVFVFLMMIIDGVIDTWWIKSFMLNLYLFLIAVLTMVSGTEQNRFIKVWYGMLLFAALVVSRYFDTSLGFISKGIFFMLLAGVFFLIVMFLKEKIEHIERNKKRNDG
jgi:uncharacterized membrane protein